METKNIIWAVVAVVVVVFVVAVVVVVVELPFSISFTKAFFITIRSTPLIYSKQKVKKNIFFKVRFHLA